MTALHDPLLEVRVESICERGCRQVWEAIDLLEQDGDLPETQDLNPTERARVLAELKSVMSVYGQRCRLD